MRQWLRGGCPSKMTMLKRGRDFIGDAIPGAIVEVGPIRTAAAVSGWHHRSYHERVADIRGEQAKGPARYAPSKRFLQTATAFPTIPNG
jgi:hypothetical protein